MLDFLFYKLAKTPVNPEERSERYEINMLFNMILSESCT